MSKASDERVAHALEAKKNGRFDLAKATLVQAIELLREENDPLAMAHVFRELGEVERSLPDTDGGVAAYERAVAIFRQQGAELRLAHTIRHLGDIQRHARSFEEADRHYQTALDLYRNHPEAPSLDVANALRGAALLKEATRETEQAIRLWSEATRLYEEAHIPEAVAEGSRRLAQLRETVAASISQAVTPAMIRSLHHVQLAMPRGREADARAFYCDVLGMIEEPKPEALARRGGAWFRSGDAQVHLGVEEDFRPAKKAHPALLVADLQTLLDRCLAAGVAVNTDEPLPGYHRAYVADPFGNRIELLEPVTDA